MNCAEFENVLDEYHADNLEPLEREACSAHLDSCVQCSFQLEQHADYMQRIATFSVPEPEPGRLAHILAQTSTLAASENTDESRNQRKGFFQGFAAASLVACVLSAGVYFQTAQHDEPTDLAASDTIISVDFKREVVVSINVPTDMPAAQLAFELPANLRLQGDEELDFVAWSVDLHKGANVLRLPLTVRAGTDLSAAQTIAATVVYQDKAKNFDLMVDLSKAQVIRHEAFRQPIKQYELG